MATTSWNGSNDSFSNAAAWSTATVPVSGDTAVINSGTVNASGLTLAGLTINLTETAGATGSTTLALVNSTIAGSTTLNVTNQNVFNATPPTVSFTGTVENDGTANFSGTRAELPIAAGGTLVNKGALFFVQSSPEMSGGTFQNDGTFAVTRPVQSAQIASIASSVTGSGTIELGTNAKLDINAPVASTQLLRFNGGASQNETLQMDQAGSFKGTIAGFSSGDLLAITNLPYDHATYTNTGAGSGVLALYSGATLEASLNVSGSYTLSDFNFTFNDFGGGLSNLQITTTRNNYVAGNLPSGYGNTPPVYRFFDKTYGTHFFTASTSERDAVIAGRPDLVEETNNFGAVTQGAANSVAVYRFFDSKYGTHFFTSSASERDQILATRADLTYEPSSTFYEHGSQQAGDVPVYRFFDQTYGTHFYTGSTAEYQGLITQGSSTFRADLKFEQVSFYAPSGSFA